jgi:prolipoprotein diacylglyceryl transferase
MLQYTPHPILFSIGNIHIYSYGLMIALAFLISYYLTRKNAKDLNKEHLQNIFIYGTLVGIIGARILYTIETSTYLDFFKFWEGGLSSFGAVIAILIFLFVYFKINKLDSWLYLDNIAPYLAIAVAIARVGCFLNGCCYGAATLLPWAILMNGQLVHPTQLYEIIYALIIFAILKRIKQTFKGQRILLFLVLYSIFRFFNEFVRSHQQVFFNLSLPQYFCILTLIIASYLYIRRRKN